MHETKLRPLAVTFFASGIWDAIAGVLYLFAIGTGRSIDDPPTHPFYSVFLASFFFCFAFLQLLSSLDIRRYALVVGCLIAGRVFYVIQLSAYMLFAQGFPSTFWFTGIIDAGFVVLYLLFAFRGGLAAKDLVWPSGELTGAPARRASG